MIDTRITVDGKEVGAYDQRTIEQRVTKNEQALQARADWNQNDSTATDYVKNRPFYTGDPLETVIVEESTVPFADVGGIYKSSIESTFVPTVGETYKISWDGTVYECTGADFDGHPILGNLYITGDGSDTGEPFVIASEDVGLVISTADTSASHTFSISWMVAPVVKIDPKYLPASSKPAGKSYLTFSSLRSFTLRGYFGTKTWDGTIEYFALDKTWAVWDGTTTLSAVAEDGEYVLYLRGTRNTVITGSDERFRWYLTGTDIKCIGNIENLLDYATVASGEHPTMADGCYAYMFYGCTSLTQAPALPATTLAVSCYAYMFYGCTSLTQAPALPATTLAVSCYYSMFYGCTSLTQAPALPATTLAVNCYRGMFYGCSSLKLSSNQFDKYTQKYRIPSSGDGIAATNAFKDMFASTGGTFRGTPAINTIYYLSSDNMIVRETDIATLNGYVGSMIDFAIGEYAESAEYIIPSSTEGSTKKFKITVDDSGTITATEVV